MTSENRPLTDEEVIKSVLGKSTVFSRLNEGSRDDLVNKLSDIMSELRRLTGNSLRNVGMTNEGFTIGGDPDLSTKSMVDALRRDLQNTLGSGVQVRPIIFGALKRVVKTQTQPMARNRSVFAGSGGLQGRELHTRPGGNPSLLHDW